MKTYFFFQLRGQLGWSCTPFWNQTEAFGLFISHYPYPPYPHSLISILKALSCMLTPLNSNLSLSRRSFQYQPLYAGWITSKVFLKNIYVPCVCLEKPMMSQKRRKLQWSLVTSLFTLHYICTYRLVFSSAFHPYQSLSMSSPYTDSLPFPSCLLRIS